MIWFMPTQVIQIELSRVLAKDLVTIRLTLHAQKKMTVPPEKSQADRLYNE